MIFCRMVSSTTAIQSPCAFVAFLSMVGLRSHFILASWRRLFLSMGAFYRFFGSLELRFRMPSELGFVMDCSTTRLSVLR